MAPFRFAIITVLVAWAASVGSIRGEDWSTFRYDNARTGATPQKLVLPLQQRWMVEAPAAPRLAWAGDTRVIEGLQLRHRVQDDDALHVAMAGNHMYLGSSVDHQLSCWELDTGKKVWTFFAGAAIRLAPTIWQQRVYFGSDDGYAYCLEAATGKLLWKLRPGPADDWLLGRGDMISRWPIRTGITIHDGIAYFGAGIFPHEDIFLYAVDATDGKVVWKRDDLSEADAGRNPLSPQGYFLTNDRYLVVPSGRSLPSAFERATGKLVHQRIHSWRREGVLGGSRAILADEQIYAAGDHQLLAITQDKGDVGFGWFDGEEMVISGDAAYTADGTTVRRLDRQKYAESSRKRQMLKTKIGDLASRLRTLEGEAADKVRAEMQTLQAEMASFRIDGVVWSASSTLASAIMAAGDLVFVGGNDQVHAFNTTSGENVWSAKVSGDVRGLAAANGFLVVSTNSGRVYVFADDAQPATETVRKVTSGGSPFPIDEWTSAYQQAAKEILQTTKIERGFCLVLGVEEGRLAFELAQRSALQIYCIEPDAKKADRARQLLSGSDLYGSRIAVHHADISDIPYSSYFANLIVSDSLLRTGKFPGDVNAAYRHLKPLGGVLCLGAPKSGFKQTPSPVTLRKQLEDASFGVGSPDKFEVAGNWLKYTRGGLRGAGSWTHQYGEPGNTASSADELVKGGLGVLWFGDPGPGKMVNRHEGAVGPVSVNGRLIVQGATAVMAYDAYNGAFLWEFNNPNVFRTGVFQNNNPSNLVASDDRVFVMGGAKVVEIDAANGKVVREHLLPEGKRDEREWTYLAHRDGQLFGTSSVRKELIEKLRRRGRKYDDATDAIFAIDVKTGEHRWTYTGKNIAHQTIALGPNRVYFIDSNLSEEQRNELRQQDTTDLQKLEGEAAKLAEERIKRFDARLAVALDAATGKKLWEQPVDVTDCSEIGIGGGKLTLMYADDVLVLCGANANGHYWKQFLAGDFKQRRLVALSAKDGSKLWAKDANYRHRPIIVGKKLIAEPWAFDVYTGKQFMREHPLTGKEEPWSMIRPGHHCGMITACTNMLFFRSGFTAFYNLYNDDGTRHFAGQRLGCWINAIPANGLVMVPEASAGCVCQFSISSTITFEPRQPRRAWTIYSSVGATTPVAHMAINLGAPGDRKDASGRIWLAYPRPAPSGPETGLDLKLDLKQEFVKGGGFQSISEVSTAALKGENTPWLYTSWAQGLTRCTLPLLGKDDAPAKYNLRLHFADLTKSARPGERIFDVKVQGKTVLEKLDIGAASGRATIREVSDIVVSDNLVIELVPQHENPSSEQAPTLNAIEVTRP